MNQWCKMSSKIKAFSSYVDLLAYAIETRKSRGISQHKLAETAGIAASLVSNIERKPIQFARCCEIESYFRGLGLELKLGIAMETPAKSPVATPKAVSAGVYAGSVDSDPEEFQPPEDAVWDAIKEMWFSSDAGCYYDANGEEIPLES